MNLPVAQLVKLGLLLFAAILAGFAGWQVMEWRRLAQQGALDRNKLDATVGVINDATAARVDRGAAEVTVRIARDTYDSRVTQLENADVEVRNRSTRPVPDSLRDLARERRIARERYDGAAAEPGSDAGPPPAR